MQSKTESPAAGLLKSHLREGAATRERSIARFMAALSGVSFVIVVMIIPLIGWPLASQLLIILGSTTCYYLGLLLLIRADRFHPLMSWLNVAIEVSIPTLFFVADFYSQGPLYALTAPPLAIWGALIVVSGLRANPALAASAGLIAGLEYMAVYTLLVMPATPADVPATLTPPLMLIRALFLLCTGILTSIVARTLVRQAEAALQAVRERDVFGKYLIHERLGAGGMAEVYRATYAPEGGFQKTVAIKLIRKDKSENASFVQMFRREAELGAMLNHANIVQVLDVGAHEDELFMAMEYVDGAPLSRVAAAFAGRLPLSAVTYIASELVTALEYLHARRDHEGAPLNLVHRDVNPPNILLTKIGEVKLSDFGIAYSENQTRMTQAGSIRGKPGYLAPEMLRYEEFSGEADYFALGVTLYESITGRNLFTELDELIALRDGKLDIVPPISIARGDVPAELEQLVLRLMHPSPSLRLTDAQALRTALFKLPEHARPFPDGPQVLAECLRVAANTASELKQQTVEDPRTADTVVVTGGHR